MAAGFCVFSDIGVVIEILKRDYGLTRIAYVDIDAHHGDGVMYPFYEDPTVFGVDLHQEGIYPMTGDADETGRGPGEGSKRNFPLPEGATDQDFMVAWEQGEAFLAKHRPEFIILQCGADSLKGDPITSLNLTPACYAHAARRMVRLAGRCCDGRLLAMGGGGTTWTISRPGGPRWSRRCCGPSPNAPPATWMAVAGGCLGFTKKHSSMLVMRWRSKESTR
jgi:acetoin utilization protein AcuC